jgi:thiamine pyrophosphate-dependent acetolactate synthase large subunit-like protein
MNRQTQPVGATSVEIQRRRGDRSIAPELGRHAYARIAGSMGCRGPGVQTLGERGRALDAVLGAKEPILLDMVITEDAPFWRAQSPLAKDGPGGE